MKHLREIYTNIKNDIDEELSLVERNFKIQNIVSDFDIYFHKFLNFNAKRLRPVVGILFARIFSDTLTLQQSKAFAAIELIHNASLIHDDIIDKSQERRDLKTIHAEYDNSLAVISGDYILTRALELLNDINSKELLDLNIKAMQNLCLGEIIQYFRHNRISSISDYLTKTKNKTASLFSVCAQSALMLSKESVAQKYVEKAKAYGINFGIGFQIINDIKDFKKKSKNSDFANGIYTAPIIYAYEKSGMAESDFKRNITNDNMVDFVTNYNGLEKTLDLADTYFVESKKNLGDFPNNKFKNDLLRLVDIIKESL